MKILQVDPRTRTLLITFDGPQRDFSTPRTAGPVADMLSKVIAEMGQDRLNDDEVLWLSNLAAGVRLIADNES